MSGEPKLKLYNTLSRSKEAFEPLDASNVRMYVCGPTVYDYAHIGNARPVIVFDVLFRLLRHLYGEAHVTYVRNITDIDDKINARAFERWTKKRPLTQEIRALTDVTLAQFHKDIRALGVLMPDDVNQEENGNARFYEPRATDFVANGTQPTDMVRIIEKLIARGHAYEAEKHVLFHVPSMKNYGRLSRRSIDDMIAGARVDVAPYKRDPMDFVLWKPSNPETEPGWESPWGYGRPGWHIECSAMSGALLGETFDIHAGGIDLIFPHHENEIAQTCCAFGVDKMASVWMHNGFLQVEGEKMSKSLGNFITIAELLETDKFGGRSWIGPILRLAMLKTHYRQPIDWTLRSLEEAESTLYRWARAHRKLNAQKSPRGDGGIKFNPNTMFPFPEHPPTAAIEAFLADDLNTAAAINWLNKLVAEFERDNARSGQELVANCEFLGFSLNEVILPEEVDAIGSATSEADIEEIEQLIAARLSARAAKNWAESDRIRDELAAMNIVLKDNKDGTTSWEVKR